MALISLLFNAFWPVALVILIISVLAHRFVWRNPSVYAAIAGGCAYFVIAILTGSGLLAMLAYVAGIVIYLYAYQKRTGARFF